MSRYDEWKSQIGIGILLGLGWILVVFNIVRAIQSDASLLSRLVGVAIPLVLALVLFAGAIGITVNGLLDEALLIAGWTVLGTAAVTAAVVLNISGFESVRPNFVLALFMIVNGAGGGAVLGFLIGLYDAHHQRLYADRAQERKRVAALSQRLSVINRVLRHDIRNQAQIIAGFAEKVEPRDDDTDAVSRIQRATNHLTKLSSEARDLQSLLTGEELEQEVLDVVSLVERAAERVQETHPVLTIECELPDSQLVHSSPLLAEAVEHVLSNAAEHNDAAEPRATVSLTTTDSADRPIHLVIADNGPGIAESEPLPREDYEESPMHHSSGVGLWLVKWLVEDSGGALEIESADAADVGTVVTLKLPAPPE